MTPPDQDLLVCLVLMLILAISFLYGIIEYQARK